MWKLLVVEDNPETCELLVEILRERARCVVAQDGPAALKAYHCSLRERDRFQAVLLDIALKGMDGINVLQAIRAEEEARGVMLGQGIPIIMLTAHKKPFMKAFNRGCDDYLLKPLQADILIGKLEEKIDGPKE